MSEINSESQATRTTAHGAICTQCFAFFSVGYSALQVVGYPFVFYCFYTI